MTEFERQQKKDEIKQKVNNGIEWAKKHPVETAIIVSACVGGMSTISKNIRRHQINKRERMKARSVYDPHTGMNWKVKRPLTNSEQAYITRNARLGIDYYQSLDILGVLKK